MKNIFAILISSLLLVTGCSLTVETPAEDSKKSSCPCAAKKEKKACGEKKCCKGNKTSEEKKSDGSK
jgi:hypothetical protein